MKDNFNIQSPLNHCANILDKSENFTTNVHSHMMDKLGKICLVDKQRLIIAEKGHVIENQRGRALRANIVKLPREN